MSQDEFDNAIFDLTNFLHHGRSVAGTEAEFGCLRLPLAFLGIFIFMNREYWKECTLCSD